MNFLLLSVCFIDINIFCLFGNCTKLFIMLNIRNVHVQRLLASKQSLNLFDIYLMLYVQS